MAKDWVVYTAIKGSGYDYIFGKKAWEPDFYFARMTLENEMYFKRMIALEFSRQIFTKWLKGDRLLQLYFIHNMTNGNNEFNVYRRTTSSYYDYAIAKDCTKTFLSYEFIQQYGKLNISYLFKNPKYLEARSIFLNLKQWMR